MKRLNPGYLCGPRAYFTGFDWKIVCSRNRETYKKNVERTFKVLLLTKDFVVVAGSHLANPFSYNLLKENPELFTEKLIIPTLRRDKEHINDYVRERVTRRKLKQDMESFYREYLSEGVDWELKKEAGKFRHLILRVLEDENSIVRMNLQGVSREALDVLIDDIRAKEVLIREEVLAKVAFWPKKERETFTSVVNLLYHLVGAEFHNCESFLSQEVYTSFGPTHLFESRRTLSEAKVFIDAFLKSFIDLSSDLFIPEEVIDRLSFKDIISIRNAPESRAFRERYDELAKEVLPLISNPHKSPDEVIRSLERLAEASSAFDRIRGTFRKEVEKEWSKIGQRATTNRLITVIVTIGGPILSETGSGILKYLGMVLGCHSIINVLLTFRDRKDISNYQRYLYETRPRILRWFMGEYCTTSKKFLLHDMYNRIIYKAKSLAKPG